MSLDEILTEPGFPVDEDAANGLRVILECLENDYSKPGVSEVKEMIPDYERKCVTVILETCYLSGTQQHDGAYLANLFRIPDAVGIFPTKEGNARLLFSSVVWK